MPDKYGNTHVVIPKRIMEEIVFPRQRRIYEQTGQWQTHGLIVRDLVERGAAADSEQSDFQLSSANEQEAPS